MKPDELSPFGSPPSPSQASPGEPAQAGSGAEPPAFARELERTAAELDRQRLHPRRPTPAERGVLQHAATLLRLWAEDWRSPP